MTCRYGTRVQPTIEADRSLILQENAWSLGRKCKLAGQKRLLRSHTARSAFGNQKKHPAIFVEATRRWRQPLALASRHRSSQPWVFAKKALTAFFPARSRSRDSPQVANPLRAPLQLTFFSPQNSDVCEPWMAKALKPTDGGGRNFGGRKFGRPGGTRTHNKRIWNPLLYQLELLA